MDSGLTPSQPLEEKLPLSPLLVQVAADIAAWFPELNGRSLAVSDAQITKQNLPNLPLVMVAFANEAPGYVNPSRQTASPVNLSQTDTINLRDDFVVEYWLKPVRYVRADNTESPFWNYFDYQAIRDRLLSGFIGYRGPLGERIWYAGLNVVSDEYATVLTFTFQAQFTWCPDEGLVNACAVARGVPQGDGDLITARTFLFSICAPRVVYCPKEDNSNEVKSDCDRRLDEAAVREDASTP